MDLIKGLKNYSDLKILNNFFLRKIMVQVIRKKRPSKKQVVIIEKKKQPVINTKHQKPMFKKQKVSEKDIEVPGNMEVILKISQLPETIVVQNDWRIFVVEWDKYQTKVTLKPKFWTKIENAAKTYPSWIAVINGKLSKFKDDCFEISQASAQIFEKKVKE